MGTVAFAEVTAGNLIAGVPPTGSRPPPGKRRVRRRARPRHGCGGVLVISTVRKSEADGWYRPGRTIAAFACV